MTDKTEAERLAQNVVSAWAHGKPPQWAIDTAAELRRLQAEVEALKADAGRLDWIERQSLDDLAFGLVIDAEHDGEYWCSPDTGGIYYGKTLRAAIDAARKGHKS